MLRRRVAAAAAVNALLLLVVLSAHPAAAHEHEDGPAARCDAGSARVLAEYRPGFVSLDGHPGDWEAVESSEFVLRPALDPDDDKAYPGGKVAVKAVHDGRDVFFILQVDGKYAYTKGESTLCPSVALMFQVGENASYNNMGGCKDLPGTCTSQSCKGHEVDIMHFSIGSAIPGRLYGGNYMDGTQGNGDDRFGHLVDVYAWNPHCRYLDGIGPNGNYSNAVNDWHGVWWHSSLTTHSGFVDEDSPFGAQSQLGTYYFEFSRPLRTMDRFQQDVQFTIGQPSKMAVAFWYPAASKPWQNSDHFSASCDWLDLELLSAMESTHYTGHGQDGSTNAPTAFALLLSVIALFVSAFAGYWAARNKSVPFTPIGRN